MTLIELFSLRSSLLENFEDEFSKMTFTSEEEKNNYYNAYMDGMTHFFVHSMISIMDSDTSTEDKAA